MQQELLKQLDNLFDSHEKWNAFLELISQRDIVRNQWYLKLKEKADIYFRTIGRVEGWEFTSWNTIDMKWYLKSHGPNSIFLHLGWWCELTLYTDGNNYDIQKITELLKTDKFSFLFNGFNRIDKFFENNRFAVEVRNFSFDTSYDTKFEMERLSWFAGHKTEEFLNQIKEKVDQFRNNEQMTSLLDELHVLTKK